MELLTIILYTVHLLQLNWEGNHVCLLHGESLGMRLGSTKCNNLVYIVVKVGGYLKHSLITSSNSIVNISSPKLLSCMMFTALKLQYVIV